MARPKKPAPHERIRLHYINEWAERRNVNQSEIAEALGVDKGTVSKWFDGALPSEANLPRIAGFLEIDLDELFRMPGDTWLKRFFERRSAEERKRIRAMIEAAFPLKDGTNG